MKTKLITALRTAANALENETFAYDWSDSNSCNCGVLAAVITGYSKSQLTNYLPEMEKSEEGTWKNIIGTHCPITGEPKHAIFKKLFSVGLTAKDLVDLEELRNPEVLKRMGYPQVKEVSSWFGLKKTKQVVDEPYCDDRKSVITYMRTWADLLVEEGNEDGAAPPVRGKTEHITMLDDH